MNYNERQYLIDKLAQRVTDDCPIEALMEHFYNDQYDYFRDMSDTDLLIEAEEILDEEVDNTCPTCTGTGEGMHSESSCGNCGGSGEIKVIIED